MAAKFQALKGMGDLLPGEVEKWQWLEAKSRTFLEAQGYREIRTPFVEPLELFSRTIGEASDIVHKEMYAFRDRGDREIALRPEMTASVARAVIENHLLKQAKSLRLYYLGAMFRAERPQAGRRRQFHQIGIELVNESGPTADSEAISILWRFLHYVGLNRLELRVNHLGCPGDRPKMISRLKKYFTSEKEKLCSDCRYRLEKNVLRIFDCKTRDCQPVIQKAPAAELCSRCQKELDELLERLKKDHRLSPKIEKRLVRGIDYYTGAVFEVAAAGLGAQDAVAGGGRYDGLYESLGGGEVPATGFSIGMERLLTALGEGGKDPLKEEKSRRIYLALLGEDSRARTVFQEESLRLREAGFLTEMTAGETSLSAHLKRANRLGIRYVLIFGEEELARETVAFKDLERHAQEEISLSELLTALREKVKG